jgi:HAD superfamily hydrolase (TIGR01509 family)
VQVARVPGASLLKAVLYDHDGTLVDSEAAHYRMWAGVLAAHGVALSESEYQSHYAGIPTSANAGDLVARFAMAVPAGRLAEAKKSATDAFLSREAFPLMPGVRESLAYFGARGLRLGIVTGAGHTGVSTTLRAHGLAADFEVIVTADDVARSKPAPDSYLLAIERLGLAAAECVAIEDTAHGVASARAAGMACVAVPNAMSARHDFSRASAVAASLAEATRWIATKYALT